MATPTLYDEDIYAWAEEQAAALRRLAGLQGLPNDLDLEHVVEEIADLGLSELNGAKSFIRNILTHLVMATVDPDANAQRHWAEEIVTWRLDLLDRLTPAMRRRIDLDLLWSQALRAAEAKLVAYHQDRAPEPVRRLPPLRVIACPFSLDDLTADRFDILEARDRLRSSAASQPADSQPPPS